MQIEELVSAQRAFFNTGATKDAAFRRRALAALRQAVTAPGGRYLRRPEGGPAQISL